MEVQHWFVICLQHHLEHFVLPDEVLAVRVGDQLLAAFFLSCVHEASLVILFRLFLFRLVLHVNLCFLHLLLDVFEILLVRQDINIQHKCAIFNKLIDEQLYQRIWKICVLLISLCINSRNLIQLLLICQYYPGLVSAQILLLRLLNILVF